MPARQGHVGPPQVALFGEAGVGNLGNDASFEACAALLRERVPHVRITVLGRDVGLRPGKDGPDVFDEAVPLRSELGLRLRRQGRSGPFARAAAKAADLGHLAHVVGGYDAVVVPGTGVLERSHRRVPGGVLVWLLLLSVACRLRGVPLAWFALGGGSYVGRLPAWTAGLAARGARYRSFRDAVTRDALPAWSGAPGDAVTHDVVFARPDAVAAWSPRTVPAGEPPSVAVAVIDHDPPGPLGTALRRTYLDRTSALVRALVRSGAAVELVAADRADHEPVAAVLEAATARSTADPADAGAAARVPVLTEEGGLDALLTRTVAVDVVVASRYHVLVAAALARRPVVALSHADKDDALLERAGLARYLVPIDETDVDRVLGLVAAASDHAEQIARTLDGACRAAHTDVHTEADRMVAALGLVPAGQAPAGPPVSVGTGEAA